jgi:putative ABC transport system permease protein
MLKNYLTIAVRNLVKGRLYSIINVTGLAAGLTVFLFISIYIYNELSYDSFNTKADRIYRIASHLEMGTNVADMTATYPPLAATLSNEFPQIEKTLRLFMQYGKTFKNEDKIFTEDILFAGPEFFDVFSIKLLHGNQSTVLKEKYQVVLTPELVAKYFGEQNDVSAVIGKSLIIDGNVVQVTGVVQEAPANSHFTYKAIMSMTSCAPGRDETWNNMNLSTYILLNEGVSASVIDEKFPEVLVRNVKGFEEYQKQGIVIKFLTQPLRSIHLYSNLDGELSPTGSIVTVYILGSVALIVLILACVNFMNLTTARSANRAKEVGVRKVLGSNTSQLVRQFTFESIIMVLMAATISLILLQLFRYPFAELIGKNLSFDLLKAPQFIGIFILFSVSLGVLAGSYPSFYLASFKPASVLKGKLRSGMGAGKLRNSLVVFQFVISIVLITCTIVVQDQLQFMRSKKLGFEKENLLIIENANKMSGQTAFINELKRNTGVVEASAASFRPIGNYDGTGVVTEENKENVKLLNFNSVDADYFETMKFRILKGRGFSRDFASDSLGLVLNHTGAKYLFSADPVGKKVYYNDKEYTVLGIVDDFNFESLKNEVKPLMFFLQGNNRFLHVRLAPGDYHRTISEIQSLWKSQNAEIPFSYSFVDDDYTKLFNEEALLGRIFGVFTLLAVLIACLGLLGLAAYTAEQRTKEISVRKVLGATVSNILVLLSKDFAKLILIAILISLPLAYYAMQEWLNGFAYKTDISAVSLIIGSALTLVFALIIVSLQALKVALLNPANTLKYE